MNGVWVWAIDYAFLVIVGVLLVIGGVVLFWKANPISMCLFVVMLYPAAMLGTAVLL